MTPASLADMSAGPGRISFTASGFAFAGTDLVAQKAADLRGFFIWMFRVFRLRHISVDLWSEDL
jgi:hypothetical protein